MTESGNALAELQVLVQDLLRLAETALHKDDRSDDALLGRDVLTVDDAMRAVLRREYLSRLVRELEELVVSEPDVLPRADPIPR